MTEGEETAMPSEGTSTSTGRILLPMLVMGLVIVAAGYGLTVKTPSIAGGAGAKESHGTAEAANKTETEQLAESSRPADAATRRVEAAGLTGTTPPRSLREAYPDYKPETRDPEHSAVERGRREVAANDGLELSEGGSGSLETLIEQTVYAVDLGDYRTYTRLTVNRTDFEKLLWPEFPQSRPAANVPSLEAWDFVNTRNAGGFSKARGLFEKRGIQLKSFKVEKVDRFTNFTLHRNVTVDITDATGAEFDFPLIRTIVERHGRFKIYSTGD